MSTKVLDVYLRNGESLGSSRHCRLPNGTTLLYHNNKQSDLAVYIYLGPFYICSTSVSNRS